MAKTQRSSNGSGDVVLVKTPRTVEERDKAAWDAAMPAPLMRSGRCS